MKRFTFIGTVLISFLILGIPFNACSKSPKQQSTVNKTSQGGDVMRFKVFSYIDKQGIGIEAFRLLIPSGWQFEGGIKWILDNPGMPAVGAFKVTNPRGKEEFEVFPNQPFFWTNNQMLLSTFPVGSRYFGNEVRPPVGALDALKGIVLSRFRKDAANLKIVSEQTLPELAKTVGAGMQSAPGVASSADAAKIRIEYQKNGVWMEEEIYGVVEQMRSSMPDVYGMIINTNWIIDYLFSFKAEKGKLDSHSKVFQTIAYSFKLNPRWFNKYNQLIEYLVQMQIRQIHHIGEISRIISRTQDEISDKIMQSYYQRQAVNDRIAENFSQYIRGVDKYYNPIEQRTVELPGGYQSTWTNNLGEYILSNDPNYNPNTESNINWQRMERR